MPFSALHDRTDLLAGGLLIGGEWLDEASGGRLDHVNPTTGKPQASFPLAGAAEVDAAVEAARAALPAWRREAPAQRRRILVRLAELLRERGEELITVSMLECGIPSTLARAAITGEWIEQAAGWAERLYGDVIPTDPAVFDYTTREPVGVVAVLLTWNAPLNSLGLTVAPPLAAGCTVLLKHSELAPFTALSFGKLCLEAGIPPGVVNVLAGAGETGAALVGHPRVDKISFTGGRATARKIAATCAQTLKPALFELGGKSANLVFADADLDEAVRTTLVFTARTGQGCTVPSRLLVHDSIYDQFVEKAAAAVQAVKVGDPFAPDTEMGPVISETACERILAMVERARADGATLVTGGRRGDGDLAAGFFIEPRCGWRAGSRPAASASTVGRCRAARSHPSAERSRAATARWEAWPASSSSHERRTCRSSCSRSGVRGRPQLDHSGHLVLHDDLVALIQHLMARDHDAGVPLARQTLLEELHPRPDRVAEQHRPRSPDVAHREEGDRGAVQQAAEHDQALGDRHRQEGGRDA